MMRVPTISFSDEHQAQIAIRGRVTDIRPDEGLAFIDKMSLRYVGAPYFRRESPREVFFITPDHVTASRGRRR
jgi:hypothetical protein